MLSNKPYIIRAFYEWINDSRCTPFLTVNADFPRCKVPLNFVEDGQITLNVSSEAVRDLKLGAEAIEFRASFSGIVHIIYVPIKAILAIYAQENGQGMFFDFEEEDGSTEWYNAPIEGEMDVITTNSVDLPTTQSNKKSRSHLKLVD